MVFFLNYPINLLSIEYFDLKRIILEQEQIFSWCSLKKFIIFKFNFKFNNKFKNILKLKFIRRQRAVI